VTPLEGRFILSQNDDSRKGMMDELEEDNSSKIILATLPGKF
jgi:hypothetical protein